MKTLTAKEEEIMTLFWEKGPLFVKELLDYYEEPKPHFNTISTFVRGLEEKGFLTHEAFGGAYRYRAVVTAEEFHRGSLHNLIRKYFNNSSLDVVSTLVREEDISVSELKKLIRQIEKG